MIRVSHKKQQVDYIWSISLVILLVAYYLLYINRCYPVNEGWHIAYAELVIKGKIPYKDFYYYMPPLDIFLNCILWKLSGGYFLLFRIYRMVERTTLILLLFNQLKKLVTPFYAWFACLIGGIFISANVYDLCGDYNQTVELLCVLLACSMIKFVNSETEKSKNIWMIVSGMLLGLAFLHKQTLIVASGITLFAFLIFYCYLEKESFIKRFGQAFAGLLIPIGVFAGYLINNHAWKQFFDQVFFSADSKGGSLFDIIVAPFIEILKQYDLLLIACGIIFFFFLIRGDNQYYKKFNFFRVFILVILALEVASLMHANLSQTIKLMCVTGYIGIVVGMLLLIMFMEQRDTEHSIFYCSIICILFVSLIYSMYQSYNGFTRLWYTETSLFLDLEKLSNVLFILNIFSIFYLIVHGIKTKKVRMEFLILCICSFISSYAGLMAGKPIVPTRTMGISASIFITMIFAKTVNYNKFKNALLIGGSLVLCMMCMGQKITCAYSWWGTTESEMKEEIYPINVNGLEGFRVSKEQSKMFEEVVKCINDNTVKESTVMGFPGITIFNLLTNHDYAGFTPVYFYDVCADKYAELDAETYKENPPDIVVWWDIPGCLETHEALFRDGKTSGQRKIIDWFLEETNRYTLICKASNIFVYKLNNEIPIGYTYYENGNLWPKTIYSIGIAEKKDYEDYSLMGNGTLDDPYVIQSKEDLIEFRNMVNSGLDFKNKYVVQTKDIDLSKISSWIPIGIMESGKYFCGIYDGMGHIIDNLTISSESRNGSETMYSGFFGQLGGIVKNLGFENGYIYGDCVGGISSHPYKNPQIINCYFKGTLISTARAGGIADNFSGGEIINCFFEGEINAPQACGIVSYEASSVVDCIAVETTIFDSELVSRKYNNMVTSDTSEYISDYLNENLRKFATLGLYKLNNQNFSTWNIEGEEVSFSDEVYVYRMNYSFLLIFVVIVIILLTIINFVVPKKKACS